MKKLGTVPHTWWGKLVVTGGKEESCSHSMATVWPVGSLMTLVDTLLEGF